MFKNIDKPLMMEPTKDPNFAHLNDLIADDNLDKLQVWFEPASGRGRRPKLPSFKLTNKLLIQLYSCKGTRSWNELTEFAQEFIALDKRKIRHLIEKTFASSQQCTNDDNLERFLHRELVPFVGVQLSGAGLTRESMLDLKQQSPPLVFTNGMIIELEKFRNKERLPAHWLVGAVFAISAQIVEEVVLVKKIKKLWCQYRINSKSQSRNPQKFKEFFDSKATFLSENSEAKQSTLADDQIDKTLTSIRLPLTPAETLNSVQMLTPQNPNKRIRTDHDSSTLTLQHQGIQIKKLRGTIDELEKKLACEKDCVQTLHQLLVDAKSEASKLETENYQLQSSVSNLEAELQRVRQMLDVSGQK